jgi:hypothetical protein
MQSFDSMKRLVNISLTFIVAVVVVLSGCEEKPPLLEPIPETTFDTAYVQVTPPFIGFTKPEDVIIGNDQLLYVADTYGEGTGRIVMMNRAGQVLSTKKMLRPISVVQDSRLDLLVGGLVVAANGDSVGALFRIHLVAAAHHLEQAQVETVWRELAKPVRRFPGITVFGDNDYLVVRTGPDNTSFVDPDARVLEFDKDDNFITPVAALTTRAGTGITDIYSPTAIASFQGVRDFVLTQTADQVAYGALWMTYQSNPEFEGWLPKFDPARTEDRGKDFIRPNRYVRPEGVAIDRSRRDVFIADARLDSVFKFNSRGTFKAESFGKVKSDGAMLRPTGLAFFERVLYVLDGDRGQVLRFRLTTDVPR